MFSLVTTNGEFWRLSGVSRDNPPWKLDEVEREWTAQIEKFLASGLTPTHFDSHHHVHTLDVLLPVVHNLPFRVNGHFAIPGAAAFTDICLLDFYRDSITSDYFERLPRYVDDGTLIEVMYHPVYVDSYLLEHSKYNLQRLRELDLLIETVLPESAGLFCRSLIKSFQNLILIVFKNR